MTVRPCRSSFLTATLPLIALVLSVGPAVGQSRAPVEPGLEALVATFPAPAGQVRAALWIGRPVTSASTGQLLARASLLGSGGEVDTFTVESPVDAAELDGRSRLQVYGDLVAAPGSYRLEIEVSLGAEKASVTYPFELHLPALDRPSVLPPFFLDDEGLIAAFYEAGPTPTQPPTDYPFKAADEFFVPDLSPRITPDMPRSRVCLIGRRLSDEKTLLESGLIASDGTMLSKERLAAVSRDEADADGLETLCLGLDTQGLESGFYQLNVVLHDFENRGSESTELPFEVVAP